MKRTFNKDDIRFITAREKIRSRPTLYMKKIFDEGNLNSMPMEIVCNALNDLFDYECSIIEITLYSQHFELKFDSEISSKSLFKEDFIPMLMTSLFAGKEEQVLRQGSTKFCDIGLANFNFCSEFFVIKSYRNGILIQFEFAFGELVERIEEKCNDGLKCTVILLKPDPQIFKELTYTFAGVIECLEVYKTENSGLTIVVNEALNLP